MASTIPPFAGEIGQRLAQRAALQLLDQRTVWRRTRKERALGYISEFDTNSYLLDDAETEASIQGTSA